METNTQFRGMQHRARVGRIVAAAFAVGGLGASALAVGTAGASGKVVVSTAKSTKFGKVLVSGKTLYTLKANQTACTAACLAVWPELVLPKGVSKATAGSGVSKSKLGSISRPGGVRQVTYGGKPLYYFVGDSGPGSVTGNISDTWGKWSDVVLAKPSSGSGGSSGGSSSTGGAGF